MGHRALSATPRTSPRRPRARSFAPRCSPSGTCAVARRCGCGPRGGGLLLDLPPDLFEIAVDRQQNHARRRRARPAVRRAVPAAGPRPSWPGHPRSPTPVPSVLAAAVGLGAVRRAARLLAPRPPAPERSTLDALQPRPRPTRHRTAAGPRSARPAPAPSPRAGPVSEAERLAPTPTCARATIAGWYRRTSRCDLPGFGRAVARPRLPGAAQVLVEVDGLGLPPRSARRSSATRPRQTALTARRLGRRPHHTGTSSPSTPERVRRQPPRGSLAARVGRP